MPAFDQIVTMVSATGFHYGFYRYEPSRCVMLLAELERSRQEEADNGGVVLLFMLLQNIS